MNPFAWSEASFSGLSAALRRVSWNALWLLAARVGSQALGLALTLLVARRLGEAGLGGYAFIAAAVHLGNALSSFGTDMYMVREVAARRASDLLAPALAMQGALATVLVAAAFWLAPRLPNQVPEAVRALQVYSLALFPLALFTVCNALLRGLERMGAASALSVGGLALQVLAGAGLLFAGGGLVALAWALLLAQALTALAAALVCSQHVPAFGRHWKVTRAALASLLRASALIGLVGGLGILYQRLGVFLVSALAGPEATGLYAAAARLVEAGRLGHVAAYGALFPVMARVHRRPSQAEALLVRTSWRGLALLAGGLALALSTAGASLVPWLYGQDFIPAAQVLRSLAWSLVPNALSVYLSLDLLARDQVGKVLAALLLAIGAVAWLGIAWIPQTGPQGAAAAVLVGEGLYAAALAAVRRFGSKMGL